MTPETQLCKNCGEEIEIAEQLGESFWVHSSYPEDDCENPQPQEEKKYDSCTAKTGSFCSKHQAVHKSIVKDSLSGLTKESQQKIIEEKYRKNCTGGGDNCQNDECQICADKDCPYKEPLHYHHDGCPACYNHNPEKEVARVAQRMGLIPQESGQKEMEYKNFRVCGTYSGVFCLECPECSTVIPIEKLLAEWKKEGKSEGRKEAVEEILRPLDGITFDSVTGLVSLHFKEADYNALKKKHLEESK